MIQMTVLYTSKLKKPRRASNMATVKTYEVAGTSTLNGVTKVRFANDYVGRMKILFKNGHENVELMELGSKMSKGDICQVLLNHPKFQSEEQQSAITEFVVRNAPSIAKDIEVKFEDVDQELIDSEFADETLTNAVS
jgi:predicted HTH transcriptional regulator